MDGSSIYRVRFHARGGHGITKLSRILGTAFFLEGFEVQDAPRYGAERRGAPIFAYVRASHSVVLERGVINNPDLLVVTDDSLMGIPAAGVLLGATDRTVLLLNSETPAEQWQRRLNYPGRILALPVAIDAEDRLQLRYLGAGFVGAAAALVGVIERDTLAKAVEAEFGTEGDAVMTAILPQVLAGFDAMTSERGCVHPGEASTVANVPHPDWVDVPFERAHISAPTIHAGETSEAIKTGAWRLMSPVIDYDRCSGCWWVCSTFCPDSAIRVSEDQKPVIDYDHCKGCMICVAQCPPHAIEAFPEQSAEAQRARGEST